MKKWLSIAVSLTLALAGMVPAALGEDAPENSIVVGSQTAMSGSFFTDMWGNNTSDMDARAMLHGYGTVAWVQDGDFVLDSTTVKEYELADDKAHNRTYTFTLNDDLVYNDGTPITAKDYVFAVLLQSYPPVQEIGGANQSYNHLVGWEDFREGKPFAGVRLLGERKFSLTIQSAALPYFYEMQMVNVEPAPWELIAPGYDIADQGAGALFVPLDPNNTQALGAELLAQTLLDPEEGYASHPMRTCGPYQLKSYDSETHEAVFVRNERYLGNYEGQKPAIEQVTYLPVNPETMFDDLASGRVGLINKVVEGESIEQGRALFEQFQISQMSYPRAGLSMLSLACELGATQSQAVRQAIALCVDEQEICENYLQGYGIAVHSYYGLGQWMSQELMQAEEDVLLPLSIYNADRNEAARMLEEDGWIYDEYGEPYQSGVRYRKEGEAFEKLALRCAFPQGNRLVPYMVDRLVVDLQAIGVEVSYDELPFPELLKQYYRQEERVYNIMLLATNFQYVFDPYYAYHVEDAYQGIHNTTGLRDEKMMKLANEMRRVTPGDREAYVEKWLEFQTHWVEMVPMVPLYSNVYFDFYRTDLQNYAINANNTWAAALLYSYLGEPREPDPLAGEPLEGDVLEGEALPDAVPVDAPSAP